MSNLNKKPRNPAIEYAEKVINKKIPACKHVVNACLRFVDDLNRDDIYFDYKAAERSVKFLELQKHTKGEWKGELFLLELWEKFIVYNLFGFKNLDGSNRFRRAYISVPKKNGKSPFAGSIANLVAYDNKHIAPELFSVATELGQARIAWQYSFDMQRQFAEDFDLTEDYEFQDSINNAVIKYKNGGFYKPLAFDEKARKDGFVVLFGLVDEYHAHKSDSMYNILYDGTASSKNPLILAITTAGDDINSPCYKHEQHCKKVLDKTLIDDSLFAVIYTVDEGDDWTKPATHMKANPNYGVSVKPEYLNSRIAEARESETKKQSFLIKHLNIWQDASVGYISPEMWERGKQSYKEADLHNSICYYGADLASTNDWTATCKLFPIEGGFRTLFNFYLPEKQVFDMKSDFGKIVRGWVSEGWVTLTSGSATDYDYIADDVLKDFENFDVRMFGYDPHNSSQFIINLMKQGISEDKLTPVRQGTTLSGGGKELERLALKNQIFHNGNPVIAWMMSNVKVSKDNKDNYKFTKDGTGGKIDGAISLINAMVLYLELGLIQEDAFQAPYDLNKL